MRKKRHISKTTNYQRGRVFEYRTKKYYEKLGYYVIRSYASKGAADLYCMKPSVGYVWDGSEVIWSTDLLLVQCKNYKGKLKQYEIDNLLDLERQTGGTPIHAFKDKNRKLVCVPIHRTKK